jgi:hypothetical protein
VGAPFCIGRLKDQPSELIEMRLESSAYGENKYNQVSTPGMLDLDLMQAVKRSHKLTSYALDSVAEEFLGEHKFDMHFRRMLDIYEEGTPEGIAEVAKYCIQDTALPLKISDKLNLLFAQIEMAKATFVPISYLINRGQRVRFAAAYGVDPRLRSARHTSLQLSDNKASSFVRNGHRMWCSRTNFEFPLPTDQGVQLHPESDQKAGIRGEVLRRRADTACQG